MESGIPPAGEGKFGNIGRLLSLKEVIAFSSKMI